MLLAPLAVSGLFFYAAAANSLEPSCLVGESLWVDEGYEPHLSGNGEVIVYEYYDSSTEDGSIRIRDFSTTPPTEEEINSDDEDVHFIDVSVSNDGQRVVYMHRRFTSTRIMKLYDRATGQSTTLIGEGLPNHPHPLISGNGEYVVFEASDGLIPGDTNGTYDVYRYEIATGNLELVSVSSSGAQGDDRSWDSDISDDGNIIVFGSHATNLVSGDTNDAFDVFYRDMSTGITRRYGTMINGDELYYGADFQWISGDGSMALFSSYPEPNYVDESQLFSYDLGTGAITRLAPTIDGDDASYPLLTSNDEILSVSAGGRFVFFESMLDNLVPGVPERTGHNDIEAQDLFVYDRLHRVTRELSYTSVAPAECTPVHRTMSPSASSAGDKLAYAAIANEGDLSQIYLATLPDMEPPKVNFTTLPAVPTTLSNITITGGQIDETAATDLAEFRIDDGTWQPWPVTSEPFTWKRLYQEVIEAASLGGIARTHEVCVRAYDARGNVGSICKSLEIAQALPAANSIIVQCLHEPAWPQPGETVTVTATAFEFDPAEGRTLLGHGTRSDGTEWTHDLRTVVDELGIRVGGGGNQPVATAANSNTLSHSFIANGDYATYGCSISKGTEIAFSGWKLFGIGDYPHARAIPIQKSIYPAKAIDIVFLADEDDYASASDPDFNADVHRLLKYGYWNHTDFLKDQHRYNIWLARDMGDAESSEDGCDHRLPMSVVNSTMGGGRVEDTWLRYYAFADTAAIVHREEFRDCAPGGRNIFSVDFETGKVPFPDSDISTVRHETAHRPFGLADEYCCDGGYREEDRLPNLYESLVNCEADTASLGRVPSDCYEIQSGSTRTGWYKSDPDSDDVSNDGYDINANDKRRIDWFFLQCLGGKC